MQLSLLLVTGDFFFLSSSRLCFLYLRSTFSTLLSCTNLWEASALHWVKALSVKKEFYYLQSSIFFLNLLQPVTSLDEGSEVCPRGISLCSAPQPCHWITPREGPTNHSGKFLSEFLPSSSHWHIIPVCLVKCHGKSWQGDADSLYGVSDSNPSHQPTCGHHKPIKFGWFTFPSSSAPPIALKTAVVLFQKIHHILEFGLFLFLQLSYCFKIYDFVV